MVPTIQWHFARIESNIRQPFMQKNIFLCRKFSFGHEPFSKQCPWLTSFPFAHDIDTYNWMTSCTHKRVTLGSPFMQKNPFLCRKFSFGREPFSKQCSQLTSFPFACDIGTNNWMTSCTHKRVTLGSPFYAEKSLFMQKIFVWAWTFSKTMSIVD